jgi:hypothetical protein
LLKNSLWLGFNGLMGLSLAPFGILGGPLVMRAAVTTGCVVGGLSFVAANAPSEVRATLSIFVLRGIIFIN